MNIDLLYSKISSLSDEKKKEVEDLIDSMLKSPGANKSNGNKAKAGSGKGMFVIKPGFDEPLEDFKEYMDR